MRIFQEPLSWPPLTDEAEMTPASLFTFLNPQIRCFLLAKATHSGWRDIAS